MIEIVKPNYTFAKVIPNKSIRNTNTHLIAKTIANTYRPIMKKIAVKERKTFNLFGREFTFNSKFTYYLNGKVSYFIYMEKNKIEFYFIFPSTLTQIMRERISSIWHNVTVEMIEEKDLPSFGKNCLQYQLSYLKEDGLSLHTNRTNNELLNASLNVVEMLEKGDKVGILYNFIPTSSNSFRHSYAHTVTKAKNGAPTERNKTGLTYLFKLLFSTLDGLIKDVSEAIVGKNAKKTEENMLETFVNRLNGSRQLSESTDKKGRGSILENQILILAESKIKTNESSYATSIADAFEVIAGDNKLVKTRVKTAPSLTDTRLKNVDTNKIFEEEAQNFIALPGRELIERYNFMERIDTHETQLPKDLQSGSMCIGEVTYRGHTQKAYLSDDEQFKKLMLLLIGPTRAGKSTLIANLSKDAIHNNECVIIFDFIKKCELSSEVAACFDKNKVLEIKCDNFDKLQGIGYNEVGFSADTFKQYENAKRQTANTLALINSINSDSDTSRLTPKMERYLESACLVVYINGGSLKDVFAVLLNHIVRHDFIHKIPDTQEEFLSEYVLSLYELDDKNKDGEVIGTRVQAGIIDRLNTLKRNTYMELMLKKNTENNIDLVEEMQKNQLIVIKMPQNMFTTDAEKDIFTTYWMTKIWLALQVRADQYDEKDLVKVNLVIDEIYQVANTEQFLKSKLSQIAKFGMKPIISCHYINQLKYMRDELRSANASYMLIAGCDKKNFEELKEELYPYTAEDLRILKRFHSLNYIKTKDGYAQFITRLPYKINVS